MVLCTAIAVAAGAAAWSGWWLASEPRRASASAGSENPDHQSVSFRLPLLGGGELSLEDLGGEIVILDYWATWCSPCHVQSKILGMLREDLRSELGERAPVRFLTVNVAESEETVQAFVTENDFAFPVLLDPDGTASADAGVYSLPSLRVIGTEGDLIFQESGIINKRTLRRVVDQELTRSTAGPNHSPEHSH